MSLQHPLDRDNGYYSRVMERIVADGVVRGIYQYQHMERERKKRVHKGRLQKLMFWRYLARKRES